MKYPTVLAGIVMLLPLLSCKKMKGQGNDMPDPLRFVLLDAHGKNLLANPNNLLKIYTVDNAGKVLYLQYRTGPGEFNPIVLTDSTLAFPHKAFYSDLDPPLMSSQGNKEWYLEVAGKIDTLHYDVQHTRPDAVFNQYDVLSVLFNSKPVTLSTVPGGITYYVFKRQQ